METMKKENLNYLVGLLTDELKRIWVEKHPKHTNVKWIDNYVSSLYKCRKCDNTQYDDVDVITYLTNGLMSLKISSISPSYLDDMFCEEILHTVYGIITPQSFYENMTADEDEFADGYVAELDYDKLFLIYHNPNDKMLINSIRDDIDASAMMKFGHSIFSTSPYLRISFEEFAHDYGCAISIDDNTPRYVDFCDTDPSVMDYYGRWYRLSYEKIQGKFKFVISGLCDDYDMLTTCRCVDDIDKEMFRDVAKFFGQEKSLQTDAYGDYYVWIEKKDTIKNYLVKRN